MENEDYRKKYEDSFYDYRKKFIKNHKLKGLFLEVTLRCNARCEHCGSSCGDIMPKDELTTDELKKVLLDIANHPDFEPRDMMLYVTGGEPLVRKDLFEIMELADTLGFNWGMTTNGILVDEKVVEQMAKTHMFGVSVSLDGLKETHESFRRVPGSFDKIINGLKLMLANPIIKDVQVTTCVNKKNIDQLDDLYELMKEIGIKDWRIIEVDPIGRAKDNDELLLDKEGYRRLYNYIATKKHNKDGIMISSGCGHWLGTEWQPLVRDEPFICNAGISIGSVLNNGDIFVCPDVEKRKELIQGNVRKDSFPDVWLNKYKEFRKLSRTENSKCKKCPDRKFCGGDAFHTWDFDTNKPRFCIREIYKEEYEKE